MRILCLRIVFVLVIAAGLATSPARATNEADLLLVLAADVSRSVDDDEFRLQREGYATALTNPKVMRAINSGPLGRIAVVYVEWSGEAAQATVIDWTMIASPQDASVFAEKLRTEPRRFRDRTAIGAAIDYSVRVLEASPFTATRRVIDVSGDGTNTNARLPHVARDDAIAKGITINGIVILSPVPLAWNPSHTHPPGGLEKYYNENVAGGMGSFTLAAEGFETFGQSIVSKLIKEIAADTGAVDTGVIR